MEKNIWQMIPFDYKGFGYQFKYSLAEPLTLSEDYLELNLISEIYGVSHDEFKESLRKINPIFNESEEFKQDIQFAFDENFINHVLLSLFSTNKVFSLR